MSKTRQSKTSTDPLLLHGHDYAQHFERQHGRRRLVQLLPLIDLDSTQDVLDVGCGNGLMAAEVHDRVRSYTGIDFSLPFIRLAMDRASRLGATNLRFEHSSIEEFCNANPQRFDVAFAFDLSEHVLDDAWLNNLRDICSSLKPGGHLYLHTPNAGFVLELMKQRNIVIRQSPEHIAVRSMADNVRLVKAAGLEIAMTRYVRHYNALRFLHPLGYLPLIGPVFRARIFIAAKRPA